MPQHPNSHLHPDKQALGVYHKKDNISADVSFLVPLSELSFPLQMHGLIWLY